MALTPDSAIEGIAFASVELSSATSSQVVMAATAGKSLVVTGVSISTDTTQFVKLTADNGQILVAKKYLPANSVWTKTWNLAPRILPKAEGVKVTCGGSSGNISVDIDGYLKG